MAYQAVPDVAHLRVEGRLDGQMTLNNLYFAISGGGITPTNLSTITLAVAAWWHDNVQPNLSEDWSGVRVTGTDLTTQTGPSVEQPILDAGGIANESAPNNVAACVSFRTDQRGRFARGRNFIPAVPNNAILLNTLDPAFISAILNAYGLLQGAGDFVPGWQWVVVTRYFEGAIRPIGLGIPITSTIFTSSYVRSMRSREVGHGA